MINDENLIKFYVEHKNNIQRFSDKDEYQEIMRKTLFLDTHYKEISIAQRMYHIINNDYAVQLCKTCKKPVQYNSPYKKYGSTCCKKCQYEYQKSDEYKNLVKSTNIERYGVENYSSLETPKEIRKEKIKITNFEKYGTTSYTNTKEFKEKTKTTNIERYGVENYSKTKEFKDNKRNFSSINKIEDDFKNKISDDYGYVRYLGNNIHILYCKKCKKEFQIHSSDQFSKRIKKASELCTLCNPIQKNYSLGEKEIVDFIKSIYSGEITENSRSIISPYELDIYLQELNLAIEYNGLYWHSSEQKDKDYHRMKSNLCKEKGIHLIHIFEDDWNYKQEIVKSVLSNFINQSSQIKVYARKCEIKSLKSLKEINEFLIDNHLLGSIANFSACYGLYYNDELVSLMSFRLINKENQNYELNRYAIKKDFKIIGGAERLLNSFTKDYIGICKLIVTYNDNSVFKGRIYEKLGFTYIRTNAPNYMFIKKDDNYAFRFPKQSIRKLKIGFKIEIEIEIGYLRVYNAGNDVYELKII